MSLQRLAAGVALVVACAVPARGQSFGTTVAAGPREILIGDPINQTDPGQVHIYKYQGGKWTRSGDLQLPDGHAMDRFGRSISLDGNRLLVGATTPDSNSRGAGYIYERDRQGNWRQVTTLLPTNADSGSAYGRFVLLRGDEAFVSGWAANQGRGVVAVFRRGSNGQWAHTESVSASDAAPGMFFGSALSQAGNRFVVGAANRDTARGQVYVYERAGGSDQWTEKAHFRPDSMPVGASFGAGVLLTGDELLVAAPGVDSGRGAVFVYSRSAAGQWSFKTRLAPGALTPASQFGTPLQVVENELWIGSPGAMGTRGAIYRMRRGPTGWVEVSPIQARDAEVGDFFGGSFAIEAGNGVVGLPNDDYGQGTAAFIARRGNEWTTIDRTWIESRGLESVTGSRRACANGHAANFECQDVTLLSFLPVQAIGGGRGVALSGIWGWTDSQTGREYALVGRIDATAFVDVTDPTHPRYLGELPRTEGSPASSWREIKVYKDYAFVVSDNAQQHGMQVFDLTRLRRVGNTPESFTPDTTYHRIHSAHNIVIDTATGYAFTTGNSSGGETCGGALHMIDIRDPRHPKFAGCYSDPETGIQHTGYTHDAQCLVYNGPDSAYRGREICINSSETAIGIADVSDKANPRVISRTGYPNVGYTHQGWATEDQRYFYVNDEGDELSGTVAGTRTLIWDISDLDDPVLAGQYIAETKAIDHNLYVKGNLLYESNYTTGLRILDISDPVKPRLVGHFDTTPNDNDEAVFAGSWSNYPFFKSGTIVVSSINEGLFVVQGPVSPSIP